MADESKEELKPVAAEIKQDGYQGYYRGMQRELLVDSDKAYGIVSKFETLDNGSPIFSRNARDAKTLQERVVPDENPRLMQNNVLLIALGTLRGVDHVLSSLQDPDFERAVLERAALREKYKQLQEHVWQAKSDEHLKDNPSRLQKKLNELHEAFNLCLLKALKKVGLLQGIDTDIKQQEELLSYCRYLSGTLDPAPIVQTVVQLVSPDEARGRPEVCYEETCFPLAQKTQEQLNALQSAIPEDIHGSGNSFYARMPRHLRIVTHAFRDRLLDHTTLMSPQLRKYIPEGLKQTFAVNRQVINDEKATASQWSSRGGTLVYTGKGVSEEERQEAANRNFAQLRQNLTTVMESQNFPGKRNVHVTMLNTKVKDAGRQDLMVKKTQMAVADRAEITNSFSYMPVNALGRLFHNTQLAPEITPWSWSPAFVLRAMWRRFLDFFWPGYRLKQAAEMSLALRSEYINHDTCASGCDRTGSKGLLTSILWLRKVNNARKGKVNIFKNKLVAAGHDGVMAHILCPGSPGMKAESRPGNLFGKERNQHIYLQSAKNNKHTPLYSTAKNKVQQGSRRAGLAGAAILVAIVMLNLVFQWWQQWLSATAMAMLGPGLMFSLVAMAVLALAVKVAYQKNKDAIFSIAAPILFFGVAFSVIAVTSKIIHASSNFLFAQAWQSWAAVFSGTLWAPVTAMTLIGVSILAVGWLVGGRVGEHTAKEALLTTLHQPEEESDEQSRLITHGAAGSTYGHPALPPSSSVSRRGSLSSDNDLDSLPEADNQNQQSSVTPPRIVSPRPSIAYTSFGSESSPARRGDTSLIRSKR